MPQNETEIGDRPERKESAAQNKISTVKKPEGNPGESAVNPAVLESQSGNGHFLAYISSWW
jgi:hypothetical protein